MHARSGRGKVPPDRIDDAVARLNEQLPRYREAQGYKGFTCLVDRQRGAVLGVSFWESEADRDASENLGTQARQTIVEAAGGQEELEREAWEVAIDDTA